MTWRMLVELAVAAGEVSREDADAFLEDPENQEALEAVHSKLLELQVRLKAAHPPVSDADLLSTAVATEFPEGTTPYQKAEFWTTFFEWEVDPPKRFAPGLSSVDDRVPTVGLIARPSGRGQAWINRFALDPIAGEVSPGESGVAVQSSSNTAVNLDFTGIVEGRDAPSPEDEGVGGVEVTGGQLVEFGGTSFIPGAGNQVDAFFTRHQDRVLQEAIFGRTFDVDERIPGFDATWDRIRPLLLATNEGRAAMQAVQGRLSNMQPQLERQFNQFKQAAPDERADVSFNEWLQQNREQILPTLSRVGRTAAEDITLEVAQQEAGEVAARGRARFERPAPVAPETAGGIEEGDVAAQQFAQRVQDPNTPLGRATQEFRRFLVEEEGSASLSPEEDETLEEYQIRKAILMDRFYRDRLPQLIQEGRLAEVPNPNEFSQAANLTGTTWSEQQFQEAAPIRVNPPADAERIAQIRANRQAAREQMRQMMGGGVAETAAEAAVGTRPEVSPETVLQEQLGDFAERFRFGEPALDALGQELGQRFERRKQELLPTPEEERQLFEQSVLFRTGRERFEDVTPEELAASQDFAQRRLEQLRQRRTPTFEEFVMEQEDLPRRLQEFTEEQRAQFREQAIGRAPQRAFQLREQR